MKKTQKDRLEKALNNYLKGIHRVYVASGFREESFYSSLKALVEKRSHRSGKGNQEPRIKSNIFWWTLPLENKRSLVCGCQGLP